MIPGQKSTLSRSEKRSAPRDWRAGARSGEESAPAACVHRLFEAQAARTPDGAALVFKNRRLSYRELNQQAEDFAARLRQLRVGPESLVAISAERSIEQIVAVLGTLKAGGAYVPVDPSYPDDRLAAILDDADPAVLVTQQRMAPRLANFRGPVIFLDDSTGLAGQAAPAPAHAATADNLAYVIFTSGSTGKPKGVLIEHRSVVNHARAMARHFQLSPRDRVLQFASLSFDVAAEEIYPTWAAGACVVLWPITSGVAPIRYFVDFVEQHGITVLNLPAPYWHEWVDELAHVGIPSGVRLVVTGSDKVSGEKFAAWRKHAGAAVRFCAAYGPTEATITATIFDPAPGFTGGAGCLPIGKPIAHTEAYVLDGNLKQVGAGEAGELYLGGPGLARGYLDQAELTGERFIRHPFETAGHARLYRTGDLARRLANGDLEFLGRIDDQLKIRGFRIELGEIENVLGRHPAAHAAVVIGRDDASGEKKLVAYVVVSNDNRPTVDDLRKFVKARLPEYMVPAAFVMLKSLPLTPGGKIDRKLLPAPEIERDSPDKAYIAPRSETEKRLVEIWERMLEARPIGIRDNFFELGGHSLLDARLVAEVERSIGITLPLATIYHTRTVENLAKTVERIKSAKADSLLQPFRTTGAKPPIFSQGGSTHLAEYLGDDQPIYWLDHHGASGFAVPETVEQMAANYLKEIVSVQPHGPYHLFGYCIGGVLMLEVARQFMARGETIGLLCLIDPVTPHRMEAAKQGSAAAARAQPAQWNRRITAKLNHLWGRIPRRYRALKRVGKRTFCDLWLRSGRRLPVSLRDFYCDEKLSRALDRYDPKPYPGSFVIFRQPDNGTESGWRALALGEVEFQDTWVDHNELLEEPYVQTLAGNLRSRLHQTHSRQRQEDSAACAPNESA
jgi:amino acid adenylation domain-containing protein